jgi:hypothetical protein
VLLLLLLLLLLMLLLLLLLPMLLLLHQRGCLSIHLQHCRFGRRPAACSQQPQRQVHAAAARGGAPAARQLPGSCKRTQGLRSVGRGRHCYCCCCCCCCCLPARRVLRARAGA